MITYRTALPTGPLAGSIAGLLLGRHASPLGRPLPTEAQVLTHLLIDRAVVLGSIRPELRIALTDYLHLEIGAKGSGVSRIAAGHEAPDLVARLDRETISWGHHLEPRHHVAMLWFDLGLGALAPVSPGFTSARDGPGSRPG